MHRRLGTQHARRWCARRGAALMRLSFPGSAVASSPAPSTGTGAVTCTTARRLYSTHLAGPTTSGTSDDASDLIWGALPEDEVAETTNSSSSVHLGTSAPASAAEALPTPVPLQQSEAEGTDTHHARPATSSASPSSSVWVTLHNMPRNWLHEEIAEMIHQVAAHAGIAVPTTNPAARDRRDRHGHDDEDDGGDGGMMTSRVSSPFIQRLHIPFGRRTGLVYGTPKLLLASRALADYLVRDLSFDLDDFRSRVYFTHTTPAELPAALHEQQQHHHIPNGIEGEGGEAGLTGRACVQYAPIEETVEREQDEALRTLELDRYLFAPDLLLDIAKSHQRRLVTKNEKVLLDAFVDGDEDDDDDEAAEDAADAGDAGEGEGGGVTASTESRRDQRRRRRSAGAIAAGGRTRRRSRAGRPARAGTLKHLGRGSMHNMPIPKPYVEGRQL